jgi:hypothetical protein
MGLTYTQALDLLATIDALGAGILELEIEGVRLRLVKEAAAETTDAAPTPVGKSAAPTPVGKSAAPTPVGKSAAPTPVGDAS